MRGELNFHMALNERVSLLEGLPLSALEKTAAATQLSSGAEMLVKVMRENGATCVLVSGGFTYFTEKIAKKCGFQIHHGNHLDTKDGVLTGKVLPPLLDKNAKYYFLQKYAAELGLAADETLAIGDGANDLPMLQGAGLGLGYRPKPLVYEQVSNAIIHTDLTSALYVQGYTEADLKSAFVTKSEPRND
jgi:phosphoserine phosphatase